MTLLHKKELQKVRNGSRKGSTFRMIILTREELLSKANIPSLYIRRLRTMAIETFKILNNMSPPVLSDLVKLRNCTSYNFGYNNILLVSQVRTSKYGKNSFKYAAAALWNSFPDDFRKVSNFNLFKSLISK